MDGIEKIHRNSIFGVRAVTHAVCAQLRKRKGDLITIFFMALLLSYLVTGVMSDKLLALYQSEISVRIIDRHGETIEILPNKKGEYMTPIASSVRMRELVLRSEDKYFYYHLGFNPVSIARTLLHQVLFREHVGGSTITQQTLLTEHHRVNFFLTIHRPYQLRFSVVFFQNLFAQRVAIIHPANALRWKCLDWEIPI